MLKHLPISLCVFIALASPAHSTSDKGGTIHFIDRVFTSAEDPAQWNAPAVGEWHSLVWLRSQWQRYGVPMELYQSNPDLDVCIYMNQFDVPLDVQSDGGQTDGLPSRAQYGKYKEHWFLHTEYHCDGSTCTSAACNGTNCIAGARIASYGTNYNGNGTSPPRGDCNAEDVFRGGEGGPQAGPCATIAPVCQNGVTQCSRNADCPGLDVNGAPDYCRNVGGNDGLLNPQSCDCRFLSDLSVPEVQQFWGKVAEDVVNGNAEPAYGASSWNGECVTNGTYPTEPWLTTDCSESRPCTKPGESCVGLGGDGNGNSGAPCVYLDNTSTDYGFVRGQVGPGNSTSGRPWGAFSQGGNRHDMTYQEMIQMRKQSLAEITAGVKRVSQENFVLFNGCFDGEELFQQSSKELLSVTDGCSMEQFTVWAGCNIRFNGNDSQWERNIRWYERTQALGKVFIPLAGKECMYDPHGAWTAGDTSDSRDPTNLDEFAAASALLGCYPDSMENCAVSYWDGLSRSAADGTAGRRYCLNPNRPAAGETVQTPCTQNIDCPSTWTCSASPKYAFYDMDLGLPVTTKTCSNNASDFCYDDGDCSGVGATCQGFNWRFEQGVAVREYTDGLVLVNPHNSLDVNFVLPVGRRYVDKLGNTVQGTIAVNHGFGKILVCTSCAGTSGESELLGPVPGLRRTDRAETP